MRQLNAAFPTALARSRSPPDRRARGNDDDAADTGGLSSAGGAASATERCTCQSQDSESLDGPAYLSEIGIPF